MKNKRWVEPPEIPPLVPLEQPAERVHVLPLQQYCKMQIVIVLGSDHIYFAAKDLGCDPSKPDLFQHWVNCGAAERFSQHYMVPVPPDNFARNFGEVGTLVHSL